MALIQSYNLALRRAFDSPQNFFTAMGGFPNQLNLAAAAHQFGRGFPATANPLLGLASTQLKPEKEPPTETARSVHRVIFIWSYRENSMGHCHL